MSDSGEPAVYTARTIPSREGLATLRAQVRPAILSVLVLTLLTGCGFPLLLFVIGRPLFPRQANGTLVTRSGTVLGSELIGQGFARPEYFQSRPSAAGSGYDGTSSGGSNLGPNNPKLKNGTADFVGIVQLADEYRARNGLSPRALIPIDAVTRSGSGLDPDITPANAALQIPRVAHARGLSDETVHRLVLEHTKRRQFGFLGNPRVPVLELNVALDQLFSKTKVQTAR